MKNDTLSPAELQALTQRRTLRQQVARLVAMGVPFRFGGGSVEVKRAVAEELPQWRETQASRAPRLDLVR
jgi:hypothetical protein